MQSEWPQVRLGNYVDSCLGKMLDKEKNRGVLFPYLGNKNVRWSSFDTDDLAQMRFEEHEHERYGLKYGDLVVCEGGEPGRCAIWKEQIPDMKIQKALHRIRPYNGLNNVYLHYWFLWAGKTGTLEPFFTGTTIKHLTGRALADLQIPLPSVKTQKAIAHILGSLDDKIELNRQMNATLEAMAQALFKSWFVDFDPVIDNALAAGNPIPDELEAKAAARQALGDARKPLPEDIRSLFPNAFVFTEEMGWIPTGWEISSLKDVSLVKGGYAFKSKDFTFSGSPVIKIKNINSDRTVDINDVQYIPDSIANKAKSFWLHTGDLLMAMTGATVGKFGLLTTIKDEHYLLNQRVAKFFPLTNLSKKIWFVYCCLNQEITTDYITNIAHGSAQPNISGDAIMTAKIIFPKTNLIRLFDENVDSIFSKMLKNNQQAYSLIQLRDTLLPKLLSGELRIPEAESVVEEALA